MIDSSPVDINHCFFQDPVNNTPGFAHRKVVQIRNGNNKVPVMHGTFVAGCAAGDDFNNPGASNQRGSAWAARLASGTRADVGDNGLLSELSAAAAIGATIHTNSWHDDTEGSGNPASYNQTAADADTFMWNNEDHLVLGSAGNNGEEQGPPGTAKNAICVCAAQADPNELTVGDGNPGPTADGRRKPDLVGVGCGNRVGHGQHRLCDGDLRMRHELGDAAHGRRRSPRAPVLHGRLLSDRDAGAEPRVRPVRRPPQGHAHQQHDRHDRRSRLSECARGLGTHPAPERALSARVRAADSRVGHPARPGTEHRRRPRISSRRRDQHAAAPGHARLDRRARLRPTAPRRSSTISISKSCRPAARRRSSATISRAACQRPAARPTTPTTSRWCWSTRLRPATGSSASAALPLTSATRRRATRSSRQPTCRRRLSRPACRTRSWSAPGSRTSPPNRT